MNPFHGTYVVSQPFGPSRLQQEPGYMGVAHFHRGIDLVGPSKYCPIFPVRPGKVVALGTDSAGSGNYVKVLVGDQIDNYWHVEAFTCHVGQMVDSTTQIATEGMTGRGVTGFHLHYEVTAGTNPNIGLLSLTCIDPTQYLQGGPDMDNRDIAKKLYLELVGHLPPDSIIEQKTQFLNGGDLGQLVRDLVNSGNNYFLPERIATSLYVAHDGKNPSDDLRKQKADFLRVSGDLVRLVKDVMGAGQVDTTATDKLDQIKKILG